MSNRLLTLAKSAPIKGPAKAVLLVLADSADDEGVTWQGVDALSQWSGQGRSTVWRHVSTLVEMGLVNRRRRRNTTSILQIDESAVRALIDHREVAPVIDLKPADQRVSQIENSQSENSRFENSRIGNPELSDRQVAYKEEPSLNPHSSSRAKKPTKPKTREHALPTSWQPTDEHRERARLRGLDLAFEAEQFRLHAETHGRTAKVWNGAFTSWLNIAAKRKAENTGARASPLIPSDPVEWLRDEWRAARTTEIHKHYSAGYDPPDNPGLDRDAYLVEILRPYNKTWITEHRDRILARLTQEAS